MISVVLAAKIIDGQQAFDHRLDKCCGIEAGFVAHGVTPSVFDEGTTLMDGILANGWVLEGANSCKPQRMSYAAM